MSARESKRGKEKRWLYVSAGTLAILIMATYSLFANKDGALPIEEGSSPSPDMPRSDQWRSFEPATKLFRVNFPHSPQHAGEWIPIPDTKEKIREDVYVSEEIDGAAYLVHIIQYPSGMQLPSVQESIEQMIERLVKQKADKQLLSLEHEEWLGHPTAFFKMKQGFTHIEGRLLMDGHRLYILSYANHYDNFSSEQAALFFDSFHLLSPEIQ